MRPRIAIPVPHSDANYAGRALPQYEYAVKLAGGDAVTIPLAASASEIQRLVDPCDGILLPGSRADVDPAKYNETRGAKTADADRRRDYVDELLLNDAYRARKPLLGICYGLQSLNVHRAGSLVQHIESPVNHEAGRAVPVAHTINVDADSKLAEIVKDSAAAMTGVPVNSSHHQSVGRLGEGLRIAACCPDDAVVEAVEGTSPDHFVLAVQWHPERSVDDDAVSRAIFSALVKAAQVR
jgi:putative glutamine amidotransferase